MIYDVSVSTKQYAAYSRALVIHTSAAAFGYLIWTTKSASQVFVSSLIFTAEFIFVYTSPDLHRNKDAQGRGPEMQRLGSVNASKSPAAF